MLNGMGRFGPHLLGTTCPSWLPPSQVREPSHMNYTERFQMGYTISEARQAATGFLMQPGFCRRVSFPLYVHVCPVSIGQKFSEARTLLLRVTLSVRHV